MFIVNLFLETKSGGELVGFSVSSTRSLAPVTALFGAAYTTSTSVCRSTSESSTPNTPAHYLVTMVTINSTVTFPITDDKKDVVEAVGGKYNITGGGLFNYKTCHSNCRMSQAVCTCRAVISS